MEDWHQHTTDEDGYCDECGETLPLVRSDERALLSSDTPAVE